MEPKNLINQERLDFSEAEFKVLMQRRISKVLIICSNYDFFMLEEDGRIDEQIFTEYVSLNLRYPPVFIQANTAHKAFDASSESILIWYSQFECCEMDV
jgi:hypothetical protein